MSTLTFNSSNTCSPSALSMGTGPVGIFHKLRNKFESLGKKTTTFVLITL